MATFVQLYIELKTNVIEEIKEANFVTLNDIKETTTKLMDDLKSKIHLIDTYTQISRISPEASPIIFDDFLPCINNLIKTDKNYWWFLNRELEMFGLRISDWIANGCETNHSYLEALISFTSLTNEIWTTSVLPPDMWLKPDIGKGYFNKQAKLAKDKDINLRVHRIFLQIDGLPYKDEITEKVIEMHEKAGLKATVAKINNADDFQDFVILRNFGVIHSATLSKVMWQELKNERKAEEIWKDVKDKTARYYSEKHLNARQCRELFKRLTPDLESFSLTTS